MHFFAEKVDRWGKDLASLWENFNICPLLHQLELPCHSHAELSSISSLKVWGHTQKPCCDIAYLLVWVEDVMQGRQYGISLVWVHPNQIRVATIEEVEENLTAYTSSGVNWPYALAQLCEDPHHAPLPKNKHLGIILQGKAQETFLWVEKTTQSPPVACHQSSSHLPHRFEWAWLTCYNHSTRPAGQQYKSYHKWTYLLRDWYPFTSNEGTRSKDATSWGHPYSLNNQSPQISP